MSIEVDATDWVGPEEDPIRTFPLLEAVTRLQHDTFVRGMGHELAHEPSDCLRCRAEKDLRAARLAVISAATTPSGEAAKHIAAALWPLGIPRHVQIAAGR